MDDLLPQFSRSDGGMRELLSGNGQGFRVYTEKEVAGGLQWMCFMLSWILFAFYAYQYRRQTCGWEGESARAPRPPHAGRKPKPRTDVSYLVDQASQYARWRRSRS
jgi:hypothetical protein